jgi:hypothetical protein
MIELALLSVLAAGAPPMRPGQWQTTITMQMPGMPMAVPPIVSSSCLTEKDLVPQAQQPGQDCKVTKHSVKDKTVEWAMECKDKSGATMTGTGKVTYRADTFEGTMTMNMPSASLAYQMTGKRLGECKK